MSREVLEGQQAPSERPPKRIRSFLRRHPWAVGAAAVLGVGLIVFVLLWFQPQKLVIDKTVQEAAPRVIATPGGSPTPEGTTLAGELTTVASGAFRSLEHGTSGRAILLQRPDGTAVLRLENLDTSNGPDLRVYLSEIRASGDWHAYGERFIDLGALKGNKGSQNYQIPSGTDLSKYRSTVIWCRRFNVGFGVAPLVQ